MNKFLILLLLQMTLPVFALCPIDFNGENVCSLQSSGSSTLPIFQTPSVGINNQQTQSTTLNVDPKNSLNNPLRKTESSNMKYNTGCQFGNCVHDSNNINNKSQ